MENTNEKVTNINEAVENQENQVQDTTTQDGGKKKGFIAKFRTLKWWQKVMIFAGAATLIYVGGKWVFQKFEAPEEAVQAVKVVVPMDPNNEMDNKVQDLVNTLAGSMTESVEETPF